MKKLKLLPSIIMLITCIAVLGVGAFAITPTKNTISGTITVTSSNPEVEIQVVQVTKNADGEDVETPIGSKYTVRSGVDLEFGDILFDTSSANQVTDVKDIIVRLDVTNKSSEDLGMYFATSASVNAGTAKTESIDIVEDVLEVQFSGYTKLSKTADGVTGTASSSITFHLKDFPAENVSLELDTLTLFFNIEPLNSDLVVANIPATTGTVISANSYKNDLSLTSVQIAEGVTEIGASAFSGCTNLKTIIIPESVQTIGQNAFKDVNFTNVIYRKETSTYTFENGTLNILTMHNEFGMMTYPTWYQDGISQIVTNVNFPATGTDNAIGDFAFMNMTSLKEITVPERYTMIGDMSFAGCVNLKDIRLLGNITTMIPNAFMDCVFDNVVCNVTCSTSDGTLLNIVNGIASFTGNADSTIYGCPLELITGFESFNVINFNESYPSVKNFIYTGKFGFDYYGEAYYSYGIMGYLPNLETIYLQSAPYVGSAPYTHDENYNYIYAKTSDLKSLNENVVIYCPLQNEETANSTYAECWNIKNHNSDGSAKDRITNTIKYNYTLEQYKAEVGLN